MAARSQSEPVDVPDFGAADPFTLDLRAELEDVKYFTIRTPYGDVEMPIPECWPVSALPKFLGEDLEGGLREIGLDDDAVTLMLRLPQKAYAKILEHAEQLSGISLGEEQRSETSSRSTATKSRRTSGRSTGSTSGTGGRRAAAKAG